ncbi:MAG: hypothetical protein JO061_05810 [Acidobacteriaceae bacterium]|nr:hypothetical protein [Acidobacteriaceae bacterium]
MRDSSDQVVGYATIKALWQGSPGPCRKRKHVLGRLLLRPRLSLTLLTLFSGSALSLQAQSTPVSITPSGQTGSSATFTTTFSDPNGGADIAAVDLYVMANVVPGSVSGWSAHQCIVQLKPASGALSLVIDAGGSYSGPISTGTPTVLSNSQCTISAARTSAAISGNTLTVNFSLSFNTGNFGGSKQLYLSSETASGVWSTNYQQQFATWTVPAAPLASPVSVTPSGESGSSVTFTATYTDPLGGANISSAVLDIMANVVPGMASAWSAHQCIVRYDPGSSSLYLVIDAGGAYSAPISAGTSSVLSNSQCSFSASGTWATVSGNTLTVNYSVSFNVNNFSGTKQLYFNVANSNGWSTDYQQQFGTWIVPASGGSGFTPAIDESTMESIPSQSQGSSCTDITGTWLENTSPEATWTLSQSNDQVTGSVAVSDPICGTVIWTVSGSLTDASTGSFTFNAANPQPSVCEDQPIASATDTVTLNAPQCTNGSGVHSFPGGSVSTSWTDPNPAPVPSPSSLKLSLAQKTTYSNQSVFSCGGTLLGHGWGYSRCGTYTLLDQNGKPILNTTKYIAEETRAYVSGVQATPHTGSGPVNEDGKFSDFLAWVNSAGPVPANAKGVRKQVITIRDTTNGNTKQVRVNCLVFTPSDVTVNDVTNQTDQSCSSF